jgi:hypothetical protein
MMKGGTLFTTYGFLKNNSADPYSKKYGPKIDLRFFCYI